MSTSPLEGLRYARRAHDLVRFTDDPADEAIARIVRGVFSMGDDQREAIRRSIHEDHAYTLLLFAKRRSASALRSRTMAQALEAVQALILITLDGIDYRDLLTDFPLYAARVLGADMQSLLRDAVAASEPGVASYFTAKASRIPEMTLESCALMEVRSSYGLGFMLAWGEHTASVDLANCAVQFADAVDAEGTYAVNEMQASSLPGVWFGDARSHDQPTTGGVSFHGSRRATRTEGGHELMVFLAELAPTVDGLQLAERAAEASTLDRPTVTAVHGRWLVLIVGGSYVQGEPALETTESLRRFEEPARALLERLHT